LESCLLKHQIRLCSKKKLDYKNSFQFLLHPNQQTPHMHKHTTRHFSFCLLTTCAMQLVNNFALAAYLFVLQAFTPPPAISTALPAQPNMVKHFMA
jgi:Flp pilus assembly protein TadB